MPPVISAEDFHMNIRVLWSAGTPDAQPHVITSLLS